MPQFKESVVDNTRFFNYDGRDYDKGKWTITYNDKPLDTNGDPIKEQTTFIFSRKSDPLNRLNSSPLPFSSFTDGNGAPYQSYDAFLKDVGELMNLGDITASGGGGTTTPGLPNLSVQVNDGNVFTGYPELLYDNSSKELKLSSSVAEDHFIKMGFSVDTPFSTLGILQLKAGSSEISIGNFGGTALNGFKFTPVAGAGNREILPTTTSQSFGNITDRWLEYYGDFASIYQQLSVGTNTSPPSSMIYSNGIDAITTDKKGVLFSPMTTVDRDSITAPATGLIIFNTDTNQYQVYRNTYWDNYGTPTISVQAASYLITGNDNNSVLMFPNAPGTTATIPNEATEVLPIGFKVEVHNDGTGTVRFSFQGSDTFDGREYLFKGERAIIQKVTGGATSNWQVLITQTIPQVQKTSSGATIMESSADIIEADCTTNNITVNLTAPSFRIGKPVTIVKTDNTANTVSINSVLGNPTLTTEGEPVRIYSDGASWKKLA